MSVFNYKIVSISDRNLNRLPKIKKTKLKPLEKIQQICKELSTFLDDHNAKVEINDIEFSLTVTTTQSEADVDVTVNKCVSGLDLECSKK